MKELSKEDLLGGALVSGLLILAFILFMYVAHLNHTEINQCTQQEQAK